MIAAAAVGDDGKSGAAHAFGYCKLCLTDPAPAVGLRRIGMPVARKLHKEERQRRILPVPPPAADQSGQQPRIAFRTVFVRFALIKQKSAQRIRTDAHQHGLIKSAGAPLVFRSHRSGVAILAEQRFRLRIGQLRLLLHQLVPARPVFLLKRSIFVIFRIQRIRRFSRSLRIIFRKICL